MVDVFILKFLGGLFYLSVAFCALYGAWVLFRRYRQINSAVIKTHIAAYKLQKLIESRSR
jgi:hypothetical protein